MKGFLRQKFSGTASEDHNLQKLTVNTWLKFDEYSYIQFEIHVKMQTASLCTSAQL